MIPIKRPRPIFRTGLVRGRFLRRSAFRLPLDLPGSGSGYRRRASRTLSPLLLPLLLIGGGLVGFLAWRWIAAPTASTELASTTADRSSAAMAVQNPAGAPQPDLGRLAAPPGRAVVVDGDTLRLQNAVVRLDGVDAPSRGDRCDKAARSDCATAAAAQLATLVRDHPVSCQVVGHDRLGRPSARCDIGLPNAIPAETASLNQQIVASGWARAATAELLPAESAARASHRGLWAEDDATGAVSQRR